MSNKIGFTSSLERFDFTLVFIFVLVFLRGPCSSGVVFLLMQGLGTLVPMLWTRNYVICFFVVVLGG